MLPAPLVRLLFLTALVWGMGSLRAGFALDDLEVLQRNPVVEGQVPWVEAFRQDYWAHHPAGSAGHYRPLASLSLRLDHHLWGLTPRGYHITNLLLHLAVVALAGCLLQRLSSERTPAAWLGLAVFALHPGLCDSIVWISGRTSMLSALPALIGGLLLLRPNPAWRIVLISALAVAGSLLGKEDGALFALLLPMIAARAAGRRAGMGAGLGALIAFGTYAYLRHAALGQWVPAATHSPLAEAGLMQRLRMGGSALWRVLETALTPFRSGSPQLRPELLSRTAPWLAWATQFALATACVGGLWILARARRPLLGASLLLSSLGLLVHSQFIPSGELFGPRFLYLPLLFGTVPLHLVLQRLRTLHAGTGWLLGLLALASFPWVWNQSSTYSSRSSYWNAVLEADPTSPQAWNALGNAALEANRSDEARAAWVRATELDPQYSRPWNNLGGLALREDQLDRALEQFERATQTGPRNPAAWANLGQVKLRLSKSGEAVRAYRRACSLSPSVAAFWRGLARAADADGQVDLVSEALRTALELNPQDPLTQAVGRRLGPR